MEPADFTDPDELVALRRVARSIPVDGLDVGWTRPATPLGEGILGR